MAAGGALASGVMGVPSGGGSSLFKMFSNAASGN
jgi:hypothetical protein